MGLNNWLDLTDEKLADRHFVINIVEPKVTDNLLQIVSAWEYSPLIERNQDGQDLERPRQFVNEYTNTHLGKNMWCNYFFAMVGIDYITFHANGSLAKEEMAATMRLVKLCYDRYENLEWYSFSACPDYNETHGRRSGTRAELLALFHD